MTEIKLTRLPLDEARQRMERFFEQAMMIGPLPEGAVSAAIIRRLGPAERELLWIFFDPELGGGNDTN